MTVKVGDVLKDNDPRVQGRTVRVVEVGDARAVCEPETRHPHAKNARRVLIDLTRIYDDEQPRKSGFSVVRADLK